MDQQDAEFLERAGVRRLAFDRYLRSGSATAALLEPGAVDPDPEVKFNPNHDAATGRFTSAGGGSGAAGPASARQAHAAKRKARPERYGTG